MGMFDSVECEYPLPDPEAQHIWFQTKDLNNLMDNYTITREGRLILHLWDYEETPKAERRYPDAPEGSFESMFGIIRKVEGSERLVDQHYHGDLYFYGFLDERNPASDWYEYRARFTEGTLTSIERIVRKGGE